MALTQQPELRVMVLKALLTLPGDTGTKAAVLGRVNEMFRDRWSVEDLDVMPSNGEIKWQNRSAQERRKMIEEGLLDPSVYNQWRLTDLGRMIAATVELPGALVPSTQAIGHEYARDESMVAVPGMPDSVPLENRSASVALVAPQSERDAVQRELALVLQFEKHLRGRGHDPKRWRIPTLAGTYLYTDLYDVTSRTLYEAKGDSSRNNIRMAIGQLLDYRRFAPADSISLLLPRRPDDDMVDLLGGLGIGCTYLAAGGFESV